VLQKCWSSVGGDGYDTPQAVKVPPSAHCGRVAGLPQGVLFCGRFAALALVTLGLYSCCHTDEHVATYKEVVKQLTSYLSEVNAELSAKGVPMAFMVDTVEGELVVSMEIS